MKKQWLIALLAAAMLLSMTACGEKTPAEKEEDSTEVTTVEDKNTGVEKNENEAEEVETTTTQKPDLSGGLSKEPSNYVPPEIDIPLVEHNWGSLEKLFGDGATVDDAELEAILGDNVVVEDLDNVDLDKLQAAVEARALMLTDLELAFLEKNITVTMDDVTGEIAFDSAVLFGGDSAELTDDGKTFLNDFMTTYASVVSAAAYDDVVDTIMIEGHTAPLAGSTYESGLPLSEERAQNVMDYCLSDEVGVADVIGDKLEAVGMSNSDPILDADGNVDLAASRRVTVRFIITVD